MGIFDTHISRWRPLLVVLLLVVLLVPGSAVSSVVAAQLLLQQLLLLLLYMPLLLLHQLLHRSLWDHVHLRSSSSSSARSSSMMSPSVKDSMRPSRSASPETWSPSNGLVREPYQAAVKLNYVIYPLYCTMPRLFRFGSQIFSYE